MGVPARQLDHQRCQVLGKRVAVMLAVGPAHLGYTGHLGRLFGHRSTVVSRHQNVDLAAELHRRGNAMQRCPIEIAIVVFGNTEYGHVSITFASFLSRSTRSAALANFIPAWR